MEASNSWNPHDLSRPVMRLLLPSLLAFNQNKVKEIWAYSRRWVVEIKIRLQKV